MIRNSPIFITYEFSMVLFLILIFQNSNVRVLIEAGPFTHYLMPIHRLPLSLSSFTKETFLESSIQIRLLLLHSPTAPFFFTECVIICNYIFGCVIIHLMPDLSPHQGVLNFMRAMMILFFFPQNTHILICIVPRIK